MCIFSCTKIYQYLPITPQKLKLKTKVFVFLNLRQKGIDNKDDKVCKIQRPSVTKPQIRPNLKNKCRILISVRIFLSYLICPREVKMLAALMDDKGTEGDDLMGAARSLCGAFSEMLRAAEPQTNEVFI